jgi:gas vesicle protein
MGYNQIKKELSMNNSVVKIIAGFVLGSALGLAAGLLIAPTTGKQARKKISKKSKKLARKMAGYIGMEDKIHGVSARKKNGKSPVEVSG